MEILLLALLSAMRERNGVKRCRELVGQMRTGLGMGEEIALPLHPGIGLAQSQEALTAYCRACRKCELGRAA